MLEPDTTKDREATGTLGADQASDLPRPAKPSSTDGWLGALQRTAAIGKDPALTLPVLIGRMAERHGDATALIGATETFTYRELASRQAAYARWAVAQGLGKGDTVCLLMPNRPEYVAIWLGLTQVGVVVALLNTNLTDASLAHCIGVAAPKRVIVAATLLAAYESAAPHLPAAPALWVHGEGSAYPRIDTVALEGGPAAAAAASETTRPSLPGAGRVAPEGRRAGSPGQPTSLQEKAPPVAEMFFDGEARPGEPHPSSFGCYPPHPGEGCTPEMSETNGRDACATLADPALLIFTSGTTGLPKAAHVGHHRLVTWSHWFAGLIDTRPEDRMYNCLPLYHSIGGVVAIGSVLVSGGSVVIAERFSATQFWRDVVTHDCTLVQYIGELCRYLVNAPPDPLERRHRLRLCAGNGLRADVWEAFQARFAVPRILEFYASTEGTVSFYNVEGQVGSIGRVPSFVAHRSAAALVRHDMTIEAPARDENGRCIRVAQGEAGELIGRLSGDRGKPGGRFEGYTSDAESARKILRDVFEPGDAWFRTGDLLRQDGKGFFYFVDRVGDTFRWKGENVSTTEVAEAIGRSGGIEEAIVYGVSVLGLEGRAGMAALRTTAAVDLETLREDLDRRLPPYARPVFLRLCVSFETTETFKLKKTRLVEDGFDPSRIADALFVDDRARGAYVPLDGAVFEAIATGRMRL